MRYIIGVLITLGLIIIAFILIFRGGGTPAATTPDITNYANTDTTVQLTIDGPINDDQDHHQFRITVGKDQVQADSLKGYEGQVESSKTYENNSTAYASFLHALQRAGYSKGTKAANLQDERGYCPTAYRYIYEINSGDANSGTGKTIQRYWSSSCGGGSYKGSRLSTNALFEAQVPDFDSLSELAF